MTGPPPNDDLKEFREEIAKLTAPKPSELVNPIDRPVDYTRINKLYEQAGAPIVRPKTTNRKQHMVTISDDAHLGLQQLAASFNLRIKHGNGLGNPSVSELMEFIGLGLLDVTLSGKDANPL